MDGITYQNKDITAKIVGDSLKGKSLKIFGLPNLLILETLPTNLPAIESNELRLDHLFLLSDGSLAIIDYESVFNRENFIKYLNYFARVIKRYALNRQLPVLSKIRMIVIYTADVERAESVYDLGGICITVDQAFLTALSADDIYRRISGRISQGSKLPDDELMELMLLPLTVKGIVKKQQLIIKAVELAKKLPDRSQMIRALAGILTFSDKVIDRDYAKQVKEVIVMTQVGQMLIDEGIEKGIEKGIAKVIQAMLRKNKSVTEIHEITDISMDIILKVKDSFTDLS